jgi:hypothetical protein
MPWKRRGQLGCTSLITCLLRQPVGELHPDFVIPVIDMQQVMAVRVRDGEPDSQLSILVAFDSGDMIGVYQGVRRSDEFHDGCSSAGVWITTAGR